MTGSEESAPLGNPEAAGIGLPAAGGASELGRITLRNEFASVAIELDSRANGPRLRIVNLGNGRSAFLDPLELASLTWLTHDDLGPFLDPSRAGWRNNGAAPTDEGGNR